MLSLKNNREQPSNNSREQSPRGVTVKYLIITLFIIAIFSFFLLLVTESPKVNVAIYV